MVTSVQMNLHCASAQTRHFYLSEHCLVAEVADGDGMVQGHNSLGKDLLALDSSSLDPSCNIVGGDLAHIIACLDDTGCSMVVVGPGVHTWAHTACDESQQSEDPGYTIQHC